MRIGYEIGLGRTCSRGWGFGAPSPIGSLTCSISSLISAKVLDIDTIAAFAYLNTSCAVAPRAVIRRRIGDQVGVGRDAIDARLGQPRPSRLDDVIEGLQEGAEPQPPVVVEIELLSCLSGILTARGEVADNLAPHVEVQAALVLVVVDRDDATAISGDPGLHRVRPFCMVFMTRLRTEARF